MLNNKIKHSVEQRSMLLQLLKNNAILRSYKLHLVNDLWKSYDQVIDCGDIVQGINPIDAGAHVLIKIVQNYIPDAFIENDTVFCNQCPAKHLDDIANQAREHYVHIEKSDPVSDSKYIIISTRWENQDQLHAYKDSLQFFASVDHRRLGPELELFFFSTYAPGSAFWLDKGVTLRRIIQDRMRKNNQEYKNVEIQTPLIAHSMLWEQSGHLDKYTENIFTVSATTKNTERAYVLRPMNCPTCILTFNHSIHSYKDLPVRMAEFGLVHRNEPSGSMHGLFRARSFTQDDGHIFCLPEQILQEITSLIKQSLTLYQEMGFTEIDVKLSLRPDKRIGTDELWDQSEAQLKLSLEQSQIQYEILPGEGAFYGPKIEFHLWDNFGRSWQCGTIQLDFSLPVKLDATYIDHQGNKQYPVMIHRAILGSIERFIGILLENCKGWLPIALAPIQIAILTVSQDSQSYAIKVKAMLEEVGFRVELGDQNLTVANKIRKYKSKKIPILAVIGQKEIQSETISVQSYNQELGLMTVADLIKYVRGNSH